MNFFKKLNVISMMYAFMFFVNVELMLNVYRISRLTGWNLGTVVDTISTVGIAAFILCTILFIMLIKSWMVGRKASYWTIILWFPYFILFILIFGLLFPMTYGGDEPNPVSGLIIIGELILYPVYIAILNYVVMNWSNLIKGDINN